MSVTRRAVFEQLAATSGADPRNTTTIQTLAALLDTDADTIEDHLDELAHCDLARQYPNGRVRVTVTGEELIELDTDEVIIIDPPGSAGTE